MKESDTHQRSIAGRVRIAIAITELVFASSFFAGSELLAQKVPLDSQTSVWRQQDQGAAQADQSSDDPTQQKIFTGVIARSGDKFVLTDPLTKTSYQLDDQRKAQEMVNKNVKVTGVLDPSTGTIRVSAIEPL